MKAFAEEGGEVSEEATVVSLEEGGSHLSTTAVKALAAALAIAIPAAVGALAMGIGVAKSVEGISRQPEASGKIQSLWMLGMVFIETAVIYALVVTIMIIFVL
ncbi:MAG: ATP synthase F0 subunit C [Lachnospiraceae bacterium]|nr:ATP synthase F0 subunit C [Lachnospiraceae bacterium]MBR3636583.1 ATP synthase F0 subunit C [Lachnospiraceae bacterium]